MNNKKAQSGGFLIIVILILSALIFGIISIFMSTPINEIMSGLNETVGDDENSQAYIQHTQDSITPISDNFAFWFFGACLIGLLLYGMTVEFSPAVMILSVIFLIIFVFMAAQYANIYNDIRESSDIGEGLTLSNIIFGPQLPIVIAVIGIIVLIFIWSNKGGSTF